MKTNKKRFIYLVLAVVMLFTQLATTIGSAESVNSKKKNTKAKMKTKQTEINKKKKEANNVSKEIQKLDKEMSEATAELSKTEKELKNLQSNIGKAEEELRKAEENLNDKKDVFNSRMRAMYMKGDVGYIQVLLASADLKDFFARRNTLKEIASYDTDLLKYMKEQRDNVEKKKAELVKNQKSIEVAKNTIVERRGKLESATRSKQTMMTKIEGDIKKAEAEYDKLNQYAKDLDASIRELSNPNTPYAGGQSNGNNSNNNANTNNTGNTGNSGNTAGGNTSGGNTGGSVSGGAMAWPVPGYGRVSSPYGTRIHPIFHTAKFHSGIDIPAPTGTTIVAAESGRVISAGNRGGYGNAVIIDHGGGIVTLYAHNSQLLVSTGQTVSKGAAIARAGSTGYSTGPHLHFEVRKNGSTTNPLPWVR